MKFPVIILMVVNEMLWWPAGCHSLSHLITWNSYTERWLADHLTHHNKRDFIISHNSLFFRARDIWRTCFSKRLLQDKCGGHVQGLCNRVK